MGAYGAFAAYATAAAFLSGGRDRVWAIWAACGYAVALVMLWCWRSRRGRMAAVLAWGARPCPRPWPGLPVPSPPEDGRRATARPAPLRSHHGPPHLPPPQARPGRSYN